MTLSIIIGIALFLASVVASQKVAVSAAANLDDATKLKLVDVFPKRNMNFMIVMFSVAVAVLLAIYFYPQYFGVIAIAYAALFLIYIFAKLYLNVRKLRQMDAPPDYIRSVIVSFLVFIGGAIAAVAVIAVGNLRNGD